MLAEEICLNWSINFYKKQNSMYTVRECNKERVFSVGVTKIQPLGSCCRCHQNHHRSPLLYRPWHFLPESYGSEQNHHPVPHFWELLYISWLLHSWHLPKMYNFKTLYTYFYLVKELRITRNRVLSHFQVQTSCIAHAIHSGLDILNLANWTLSKTSNIP